MKSDWILIRASSQRKASTALARRKEPPIGDLATVFDGVACCCEGEGEAQKMLLAV
jgi:hypothetical protein